SRASRTSRAIDEKRASWSRKPSPRTPAWPRPAPCSSRSADLLPCDFAKFPRKMGQTAPCSLPAEARPALRAPAPSKKTLVSKHFSLFPLRAACMLAGLSCGEVLRGEQEDSQMAQKKAAGGASKKSMSKSALIQAITEA